MAVLRSRVTWWWPSAAWIRWWTFSSPWCWLFSFSPRPLVSDDWVGNLELWLIIWIRSSKGLNRERILAMSASNSTGVYRGRLLSSRRMIGGQINWFSCLFSPSQNGWLKIRMEFQPFGWITSDQTRVVGNEHQGSTYRPSTKPILNNFSRFNFYFHAVWSQH